MESPRQKICCSHLGKKSATEVKKISLLGKKSATWVKNQIKSNSSLVDQQRNGEKKGRRKNK